MVAGAVLGWPGLGGLAAGHLLVQVLSGHALLSSAITALWNLLPGLLALVTLLYLPELGRGLPNVRSYAWLVGVAVVGVWGTTAGWLLTGEGYPPVAHLWAVAGGNVTVAVLLTPPLLLAADRYLRPWMAPIPGEVPARSVYRLGNLQLPVPGDNGEETVVILRQRPELGRGLLKAGAQILLVTLVVLFLWWRFPAGNGWIPLLYLVPVVWTAGQYGLRGGVLASCGAGCLLLVPLTLFPQASVFAGDGALLAGLGPHFITLSFVGALLGASREEGIRLQEELRATKRLLQRDLLRVVQALTGAVEAKDLYTEGHLRRVSEFAVRVGERLGLKGHSLEVLYYASVLHDIGKLGVPEEVLRKPGPLDDLETTIMQRHPEIGARLLHNLDLLREVAPLVRHHQERYDGLRQGEYPGYPLGLKGEKIPLGARIIAVVDAFDAMTTDRPYRRAMTPEEAMEELRRQRGRQFDPKVVDAFLNILKEEPWD